MRQETIENYLKTIYNLSAGNTGVVSNSRLSEKLNLRPGSVTESLIKLHGLKYVVYEKSYGSRLTAQGARLALGIVRRHRIWETYLVKELGFGWDEVHEIAEELEHVKNDKLINKLSEILGNPIYDPHGDPIPDARGKVKKSNFIKLSEAKENAACTLMGVSDHTPAFLRYLERSGLLIGSDIMVKSIEEFDRSLMVSSGKREIMISLKVAENLIVAEN